jgi:hypothetical protein
LTEQQALDEFSSHGMRICWRKQPGGSAPGLNSEVLCSLVNGVSRGTCIADLELTAKAMESEEIQNRVIYVPL